MEARAMARLNHPHIVAVYDAGEDDGISHIVMELVRGKTLSQLEGGELGYRQALGYIGEVLEALDYANSQGIHAPRHQAVEHHDRRRRQAHEADRFRPCAPRERSDANDAHGTDRRNDFVSCARALFEQTCRRAQRSVFGRHRDVRDLHGHAAVPQRPRRYRRDDVFARARSADASARDQPQHSRSARTRHHARDRERPGRRYQTAREFLATSAACSDRKRRPRCRPKARPRRRPFKKPSR